LGNQIVIPQLQQELAGDDPVTFFDRQPGNLPADAGGELGAAAGFDRPGPGIGDNFLYLAGFDGPDDNFHRNGSCGVPYDGANCCDDDGEKRPAQCCSECSIQNLAPDSTAISITYSPGTFNPFRHILAFYTAL
jgi:hypothetical protein